MRGSRVELSAPRRCVRASGGRPEFSFSGLPGVTSHHTRSRPSRRSAISLTSTMACMRRVERAAEQADAHARRVREEARGRLGPGGSMPRVDANRPATPRAAGSHGRICPSPRTRYLKLVSCSTPTGPRACMRPVAMPISAPKPNSPPSANCVEALCSTIAESTSSRKRSRPPRPR